MINDAARDAQHGPGVQVLEELVDAAYRDPRKLREMIERAYWCGRGAPPLPAKPPKPPTVTEAAKELATRLRRKAKVVQECDGREVLLEMAAELDGGVA